MTPDEKAHYYGRMEKNFPQFLKAMERLVAVPSYLKEDDDYPMCRPSRRFLMKPWPL